MDIRLGLAGKHRSDLVKAAAKEIEKCVHCGFCLPACPTYSIDNNELDSPRGRIYLVKRLIEEGGNTKAADIHLGRCLSCRSCEVACPSGVGYSTIAHAGGEIVGKLKRKRTHKDAVKAVIIEALRSKLACKIGRAALRACGPLAPKHLRKSFAKPPSAGLALPKLRHEKKIAVVTGCAQMGFMPETNIALARLLDMAGHSAVFINSGCCGALRMHNDRHRQALADIKSTIKECKAAVDDGAVAVMAAASGCASFVTEYGELLAGDKSLADDAKKIAGLVIDPAVFLQERLDAAGMDDFGKGKVIAAHVPCTLKNGLRSPQAFPELLEKAGFVVTRISGAPNCCGSAGTNSLFYPKTASLLRSRLVQSIEATEAAEVATANIGCALHVRQAMGMPVNHWIDILAASAQNGTAN